MIGPGIKGLDMDEILKEEEEMSDKKSEEPQAPKPRFEFIMQQDDPKLYQLEEKVNQALHAVCRHREKKYGEDFWKQSMAEAIYTVLDGHGFEVNMAAIEAYLVRALLNQHRSEETVKAIEALAEHLLSVVVEIKGG
jgi:hypothetical protein